MKKLLIVGTPIGNLADFTPRGIEALKSADLILCEDTRVTLKLLNYFKIQNKVQSCNKLSEKQIAEKLSELFATRQIIAFVTDAGMPAISDPGAYIVNAAIMQGIPMQIIPGPSAVDSAMALSGISDTVWAFAGFLPRKSAEQKEVINAYSQNEIKTFVFYESPLRIVNTLQNFADIPVQQICVFNDLTKLYERAYYGTVNEVLQQLMQNPNQKKGEYVFIVQFKKTPQKTQEELSIEAILVHEMVKGQDFKTVCSVLQKKGFAKNDLYKAHLKLKELF